MSILVKLVPVLAAVALGCAIQPGDPNGGPEQTASSAQAMDVTTSQPTPTEREQIRSIREAFGVAPLKTTESLGGPTPGSGTGDPQDPGDGNDPVPQPWNPHCSAQSNGATVR